MDRLDRCFLDRWAVPSSAGLFLEFPLPSRKILWLSIALFVFSQGPAHAGWVAVERSYLSPNLQTVYVDPSTLSREENRVTIRQLTDYKWMQGNVGFGRFMPGPHRFFSTMTHKQFDCATKRVRLLAYTEFSRHMGTGRAADGYVDKDTWLPVEPESVNQALWEVACSPR